MNIYLSFLHDFGILFMFDDDGLYQQCFRITLHAHFIEPIDVSTRLGNKPTTMNRVMPTYFLCTRRHEV